MKAIAKRSIYLYLINPINMFFSLLGSLIVFFLYLLFIKQNIVSQFQDITSSTALINLWMLGALLTVTSLTTSFSAIGQFIQDKSSNKLIDFTMTDISAINLLNGYFISSFIVSLIMQSIVFLFVIIFFLIIGEPLNLTINQYLSLFPIMLITSLTSTSFNLMICAFIKNEATLRTIASIMGALSGFLTGAYIPIGALSDSAKNIIRLFPLSYSSSMFRYTLMSPLLNSLPKKQSLFLEKFLGLNFDWKASLNSIQLNITVLFLFSFICLSMIFLMRKYILTTTLSERN
ncbi:hypothetical protein BW731_01010 [Vagococcus martis]|uniref:ABC-2 type transporter transmembrane domain-containing protein n=1 Tax=Vagococcus martis TaxID=1768210 RepID=A0A1V4DEF4_9ENTE|nr:ABC transporter permease [Vagococcus martis]OPF86878.1 hypothetical protein BW731_01010 [Vagococcus martis]